MIFAASSTSNIERSLHQVILKSSHFAHAMESSSSGLSIAALAASTDRFSQDPYPIHMRALQAFSMTDFTSAKSTLIKPGWVMRSEIHWTHWFNTSSTMLNASSKGVFLSMIVRILSFGMVMRVSTLSFSFSNQSNPWKALLCHSKAKGFVTTQTTSAQRDFAISAMIGAAPVPVQPHIQQVMKTMSAQAKACLISSLDSSAAFFHISGFAPAQSHRVVALHMLILI